MMSRIQGNPAGPLPFVGTHAEFRSAMGLLLVGMDRPMATRLLAATVLAIASGGLLGMAPVALKELIEAASRSTTAPPVPTAAVGIAGLGLAYLFCLATARLIAEIRPYLVGVFEQRLYANLRLRYFGHVMDMPLSFHLAGQTGALGLHLQQAVTGYQVILSSLLNGIAPVLVEAITIVCVLTALGQPALAINLAITALALWLITGFYVPRLQACARAVTDASSAAHGHLIDSLINYEPIKCFGAEARALDGLRGMCMALELRWQDLHARRLGMGAAVTATFTLSVASSLTIALHGLSQSTLSLGGFVLTALYTVQIIRPLEQLSSAARDVAQGLAFVRPLHDTLRAATDREPCCPDIGPRDGRDESSPDCYHWRQGAPERPAGVSVSFRGVRLCYGGRSPVLCDLNLEVPAGRSLAIVGASGGGKSSILRLLLRLCKPDEGCICLDGVPIDTLPVGELRSMIAVVPQDLALLNSTIGANIALGTENPSRERIVEAARFAGLENLIGSLPLGLDTMIGERGLKLSGGERQRIAIARAILRNPRLYLLDEASSMLDPGTEQAIMQRFLASSRTCTVITVAHRLTTVQHADSIAVLAEGRIVEQGSHAELMATGGIYAGLLRAQECKERG